MSIDEKPSGDRAQQTAESEHPHSGHPPSKPLQVFLLIALLISGAAYVVDQYSDYTTEETLSKHSNRLRQLVQNQSEYITNTELGREAEAKRKYDDAIVDYRRALHGQDKAESRLNLGNVLLKEGNPNMAFSQFKDGIRLDPDFEAIYVAWGKALKIQGKLDDAVQLYEDALRHNSNFAQVHYNFALVLEQKQQAAQAVQLAAESANQSPAATKAADEAQLFGSDAVKHYAAAERLGLNTPEFWCSYGTQLSKQGKFPEAEARLTKAVMLQPGLGAAQFQLAVAQDHQGEYADAIGHYEATLVAIPDDPAALDNLALLYATATNQDVRSSKMAVVLATRACDATDNQNARYLDTLGRAYASDGDFNQARDWESKAVQRAAQLGNHELLREFQPRFILFLQHKTE
jgi:tetratricopeptide (TPR) repeat protein